MRGARHNQRSGATVIFLEEICALSWKGSSGLFEESAAEKLPINSVIGENMTTLHLRNR